MQYRVTIELTVDGIAELFEAATERATAEGIHNHAELLTNDNDVDISACLVMLLDPGTLPGCSIRDTSVD
jgi:hypothetical protein